jgi:hypothetical protein
MCVCRKTFMLACVCLIWKTFFTLSVCLRTFCLMCLKKSVCFVSVCLKKSGFMHLYVCCFVCLSVKELFMCQAVEKKYFASACRITFLVYARKTFFCFVSVCCQTLLFRVSVCWTTFVFFVCLFKHFSLNDHFFPKWPSICYKTFFLSVKTLSHGRQHLNKLSLHN